ncbi:GNAT family N-acetyltransferase [Mycolicibacterium gilvum]|uniref:GNAT family N-acetyltransferase n=1 Tax=Mycolicibacterium gilvum TaxID=1804 RepID=UPI0040452B7A
MAKHLGAIPTLEGVTPDRRLVRVRAPRFKDAAAWRDLRISDQERIEPFWAHSEQSWADRHRRRAWYRSRLAAFKHARRGDGVHTVIEVDGAFAGQCDVWLDRERASAEVGLWLHSRWAGTGVATTMAELVLDLLFGQLGIERLTAPIAASNVATRQVAKRMGFQREGCMRSYMLTGQGRTDHELWALTRSDWADRRAR